MSAVRNIPDPDDFVAGTLGPPGRRVFYLQVRTGPEVLTLRLEKQQVLALAAYLAELLSDLPAVADATGLATELRAPVDAAWVVGELGAGFRGDIERFVITMAEAVAPGDDEAAPGEGAQVTVQITPAQAANFVRLSEELASGGRPPCPLCGKPMDPDGHACVKSNGHGH
jgi:uncharacterized repeat protein (TIGR03847 family)